MSLGKSSSMAAVLLLVVVVAGTFASGAQATFNITNDCNKTVVIKTANGFSMLDPGKVLRVTMSPHQFFSPPVTVTTTVTPVVTGTLSRMALEWLNKLGESVLKISITYKLKTNCIALLALHRKQSGPFFNLPLLLGLFCP